MTRRFFSDTPINGGRAWISGPEANHIANVNRCRVNDELVLFDGSDREFDARIYEISKNRVGVEILNAREVSCELANRLTLAVALPKGDRQKSLVEKLVELGVASLIPLACERSVAVAKSKSIDKLGRWVIEASKQCGRNRLMEIEPPRDFEAFVGQAKQFDFALIAHPHGAGVTSLRNLQTVAEAHSIAIAIGPEGGFSDDEIALALKADWKVITLATTILRVETAAVVAATLLGIANAEQDSRPPESPSNQTSQT